MKHPFHQHGRQTITTVRTAEELLRPRQGLLYEASERLYAASYYTTRYRPAIGSHGARRRARSAWPARLIHCPTAVNRSFRAAVNAQTAIATGQPSG